MNKIITAAGVLSALLLAACGGQTESQSAQAAPAAATAAAGGSAAASVAERQDLMQAFKKDFGALGKMVKGETPYDAEAFKATAARFNDDAPKPWAHYGEETAKEPKSEAKPEVWSKPAEFKQETEKFVAAVAALNTAAASGSLDAVRKPFGEVGQSCKSCHSAFRAD